MILLLWGAEVASLSLASLLLLLAVTSSGLSLCAPLDLRVVEPAVNSFRLLAGYFA